LLLGNAATLTATDRNARMIDTLAVQSDVFDDGDAIKGTLWSENAFASPYRDWTLLLGGGAGSISPDDAESVDFWEAGFGLKYYITILTSLSLVGQFGAYYDIAGDPDTRGGTFTLKQRFIPADQALSPYVAGAATYRTIEEAFDGSTTDDYTEVVAGALLGCDFMLTESLAIVLESGYSHAEEVSGEFETPDAWSVSLGFKGYWE
jgi:hypothetical protein